MQGLCGRDIAAQQNWSICGTSLHPQTIWRDEVVSDVSERAVVQQIAPRCSKTRPNALLLHDEDGATFSLFRLKVAMDLHTFLASVSNTPQLPTKSLTKEEVLAFVSLELKQEGLVGGGVYLISRNNDARLVIENIKRANQDGALSPTT